ncbi:unnamed protein product [Tilletia controversa]|nr:unnamed protein product [Tilletia controversa]
MEAELNAAKVEAAKMDVEVSATKIKAERLGAIMALARELRNQDENLSFSEAMKEAQTILSYVCTHSMQRRIAVVLPASEVWAVLSLSEFALLGREPLTRFRRVVDEKVVENHARSNPARCPRLLELVSERDWKGSQRLPTEFQDAKGMLDRDSAW